MAVDGIACRAGVLARDAARLRAFLQEASLVDDQHAAHLVPEVLHDVVTQIVAHPVGVPGGRVQEALDTLCAALANRLGQLPAVLALDALKQTGQVEPGAFAYLGTREAMGDARVQCIQCFRPPCDDDRFSAHLFRDHAPSSALSRKHIADCTYVSL